MRCFVFFVPLALGACAALAMWACGSDEGIGVVAQSDASADGSTADGTAKNDASPDAAADVGFGASICPLTREYTLACNGQLNCGDAGFDTWCAQNDRLVNSEQFREGARRCLRAPDNCNPVKRSDCQYKSYTQPRTAAQQKVVDDYCATCFPQDVAGCKQRSVTYDPDAGPSAVPDIFIAAWELSDSLTTQIDTKCTGAALDAGTDDGGCAKAFADCAGGLYIDTLPNCP
jgi:hypothetical protein